MVQPDDIETYIRQGLDCTHLRVDGDGHHFEAVIVSPAFEGLRLVARHQKVYGVLGDRMRQVGTSEMGSAILKELETLAA